MPQKSSPRTWVVIPAHNEAKVISRCLDAILTGMSPGEFEVIVVPNGCTDDTARIARSYEPRVRVIELDEGSKSAALNAGDGACEGFPRLYVDADVVLSTESVRAAASALDTDEPLIATPRRNLQLANGTRPARWYYRTWEALQAAREETIGVGVYALNEAGRRRFGSFPKLVGDDTFVHSHFRRNERRVIEPAVQVWPPQRLNEIVDVRSRIALGNLTASPGPGTRDRPSRAAQARRLLREPRAMAGMPLYITTTLLIRKRARARLRRGDYSWSRAVRVSE